MTSHDSEALVWSRLDIYLKRGTLIPVLGTDCVTFGPEDKPLYPWLAEQLASILRIPLPARLRPPLDLVTVATAALASHRSEWDLRLALDDILKSPELSPGPLLKELARIQGINHFFTTCFDTLLERALTHARSVPPQVWEFPLNAPPCDLPFAAGTSHKTLVGYLFGRISGSPSFRLWDHDTIEILIALQRQLPNLGLLAETLATNNLLFLGTDFSDWLARFFLRTIRNGPLKATPGFPLLIASRRLRASQEAVLFYDALGGTIDIVSESPLEFVRRLVSRAPKLAESRSTFGPVGRPTIRSDDREGERGAIFVSYFHEDRDQASRIADKLARFGCRVWLDQERVKAGQNFDNCLEKVVKEQCGFFLSVVTARTEGIPEAYFHMERRWAAQRFEKFAEDEDFYIPVAEPNVQIPPRQEPKAFSKIQVERLTDGEVSDDFCIRLRQLQSQRYPQP